MIFRLKDGTVVTIYNRYLKELNDELYSQFSDMNNSVIEETVEFFFFTFTSQLIYHKFQPIEIYSDRWQAAVVNVRNRIINRKIDGLLNDNI